MNKTIGGGVPVQFEYNCWKCPKWHETDQPIAAARFAVVRVTTPLGTIKFPDVTYLMQLPKIRHFRLSAFIAEYAVRCTGCNRLKLIKNLWFHGRGEQFCYKCM
jgi:hypothetical protein